MCTNFEKNIHYLKKKIAKKRLFIKSSLSDGDFLYLKI
jgi:hypothetical protein